ncbi:hypothetical protein PUN28_011779 [Cardiocondyla obscurior]
MKMTYPGFVLLVGVGVGIATFLYYMFTDNNRSDGQYSYSRNRRSSEDHSGNRSWSTARETVINRRSSASTSNSKERKDNATSTERKDNATSSERKDTAPSKDDITKLICSICQFPIFESERTQLRLCKHIFHKDCIRELTKHNPGAVCPNCRTKF